MPDSGRTAPGSETPRVALLTNILPPYRVPFLNELAKRVELFVVVDSLLTPDRGWQVDTRGVGFELLVARSKTLRVRRTGAAGHAEARYTSLANRTLTTLRQIRPDLVVTGELGLRSAQAFAYARLRGIPAILFWEGTPHTEARIGASRRDWRRLLLRGASRAWVNGRESAGYLEGLGFPAERMTPDMTGVDTAFFRREARAARFGRDRRRADLGLRGLVFGVCGALSARKGVAQLLAALERLSGCGQPGEFSVLFIGDGEERGRVEAWARAHPRVPVRITGFRQLAELPALYSCVDWCVLPTLEDCWALATVEPIACGLPQIFSRYNGASADLVRFADTGLIADPLDPAQFADSLGVALAQGPRALEPSTVEEVVERYGARALAARAAGSIEGVLTASGVGASAAR